MRDTVRHAEEVFAAHGGLLRTRQALDAGIHPRTLYRLRDQGLVERICRGVYRWADLPPLGHPDLVAVATRVPRGIICLISALYFHEITTQIPHEVHLAVPRDAAIPRIDQPPVRVFRFSLASYRVGVQKHSLDGAAVRVFSAPKTIADCFQRRRTIGLDVAIEALRIALETGRAQPAEIERFARTCRVERVIAPYLEALS